LSSRILIKRTGGWGGFFASVRDIGVTGQQQQPRNDSAEEAIRGGAGGFFISRGGGTKPASPVPSPEINVPVQSVAASAAVITFLVVVDFISRISINADHFGRAQIWVMTCHVLTARQKSINRSRTFVYS